MNLRRKTLASLPVFLLLAACSEEPKPGAAQKEPEKPAEAVSSQFGFQQMYITARAWAPDAQPLRLGDLDLNEVKSQAGKAGAWQCTFVSERNRMARTYTYSVVESGPSNIHKGVFGGPQESWSGGGQAKPFPIQAFKVDATTAYETAQKKSADYVKKHPDMRIKFLLEQTPRFPNPAWRVIWGESVGASNYSIFVDATTGDFLQIAH
jgi:hypothetical protein